MIRCATAGLVPTALILGLLATTAGRAQDQAAPGPGLGGQPLPAAPAIQTGTPAGDPPPPQPLTPEDLEQLRQQMLDTDRAGRLTGPELGRLRDQNRDSQRALSYPTYSDRPPPMAQRREIQASPSPSTPPYPLRLWQGMISAVTFLDRAGAPWPVTHVAWDRNVIAVNGDGCSQGAGAIDLKAGEGDRTTSLFLMPCSFWSWANIVVTLEGLPAPIVFQIQSGDNAQAASAVDMGVTVRLPGRSPLRPQQSAAAAADAGFRPDAALDDFLNAVPPKGARSARVIGAGAAAWIFGGALYLRGDFTVLNPTHQARASYGQLQVWRFDQPISRVLIRDRDGAERALTIDF